MKGLFLLLLVMPVFIYGQTVSNTYGVSDIPTSLGSFLPSCNGVSTSLAVTLPAGGPVQVTGIDIVYNMTAQGGGFKSHQRSQIHCQTTNITEATVFEGTGDAGGIQAYSRNNVSIANGSYGGGTNLIFEMHAWRTTQGSGCNTTFNKVDNFTWTITVHYSPLPPDGRVGIGTTSPNPSAILDISSVQKGLLIPRMTKELRDAIPSPAEGLLVFCTNCTPASLYQFKGSVWTRLSGVILEDADGDTKIMVEKNPDEDKIRFDLGGSEYYVMNGPRLNINNSGHSVFVGENAGNSDDLSNNENVFIGYQSGQSTTTGFENVAIGGSSFTSNTSGSQNTALGFGSMQNNTTGLRNTAIGRKALQFNSTATDNTALGYAALLNNTTGAANTAGGMEALFSNTTGQFNTAVGRTSLKNNTTGESNTAIGMEALFSNTTASQNTAVGKGALFTQSFSNGNTIWNSNNVAIGFEALYSNQPFSTIAGSRNTGVGTFALRNNSTGYENCAIGYKSLFSNTTGIQNLGIGTESLSSNTFGDNNTSVGPYAMHNNVQGDLNTAIGAYALSSNTIGDDNIAIGVEALNQNTTASRNIAIGDYALFTQSFTNGTMDWYSNNIAIGYQALEDNQPTSITNGIDNVAIGVSAMASNTIGYENTAIGNQALKLNTGGAQNTATGFLALGGNTSGNHNSAFGRKTLFTNSSGNDNTAMGYAALFTNSTGIENTAMGMEALFSNTTGSDNTAVGRTSLKSNTTGIENSSFGSTALSSNTTGKENVAVGYSALFTNSGGQGNTAIGWKALNLNGSSGNTAVGSSSLSDNTTGYSNCAFGNIALLGNISGHENTGIGNATATVLSNLSNATVIGYLASVNANNKVRIGNSTVTVIEGAVDWSVPSDARFKSNIHDDNIPGLSFIQKLRPVTYEFDSRKFEEHLIQNFPDSIKQERLSHYDNRTKRIQTGFLAQEVEAICNDLHYEFSGLHIPENETDNYSLAYGSFVPLLVKAIQEQQVMITTLTEQNNQLEKNYRELKELVETQQELLKQLKAAE